MAREFQQQSLQQKGGGSQDFSGTYAVLATGEVILPGFPITGPFARSGLAVSDGNGNVEFLTTSSYSGFVMQEEDFDGTYTVGDDCRVTLEHFHAGLNSTVRWPWRQTARS